MLHKISDFCKKIDGLKSQADKLYNMKYNNPKTPERDAEINHLIDDIQATCKLIGNDNKPYDITKEDNFYDENGLPKNFTDKFRDEGI